ncbi:861_t:CDS:1, partial [Racocetra persica]
VFEWYLNSVESCDSIEQYKPGRCCQKGIDMEEDTHKIEPNG